MITVLNFAATRMLPAIPVPPRSLVIQRFPPPPEKPRKKIILTFLSIFFFSISDCYFIM